MLIHKIDISILLDKNEKYTITNRLKDTTHIHYII
jgi:hypothetical protein